MKNKPWHRNDARVDLNLEGEHHTEGRDKTAPATDNLILRIEEDLPLVIEGDLSACTEVEASLGGIQEAEVARAVTNKSQTNDWIDVDAFGDGEGILEVDVKVGNLDIVVLKKVVHLSDGTEVVEDFVLALQADTEVLEVANSVAEAATNEHITLLSEHGCREQHHASNHH